MTAVWRDAGTAVLICNQCGNEDGGTEISAKDGELVWPVVASLGWSGSPFATGTHRCPRCSRTASPAPEATSRPAAPHQVSAIDRSVRRDLNAVVITPPGDLDAAAATALRDDLMDAAERGVHVVMDLHRVHVIDPAALGLLVRAHQRTKQQNGILALAAPSRFVLTVLHTMRLDTVFTTYADQRAAIEALSRDEPMESAPERLRSNQR
ncbi:STAS domain-containing protein [Actinoplanes sp. NPDC051633]|uniref:STAS domain-containing protein n=1 Tax=Actinoplanes sp. NPDC051633 TaxID=3155670 RepID=UPI0034262E47